MNLRSLILLFLAACHSMAAAATRRAAQAR